MDLKIRYAWARPIRNRITLTPPEVDPEQPPSTIKKSRSICVDPGQEAKSPTWPLPKAFPYPPLVAKVMTLNEAFRSAVPNDRPS